VFKAHRLLAFSSNLRKEGSPPLAENGQSTSLTSFVDSNAHLVHSAQRKNKADTQSPLALKVRLAILAA
jgi:hypothetical protein